jgi:hypothetical protein
MSDDSRFNLVTELIERVHHKMGVRKSEKPYNGLTEVVLKEYIENTVADMVTEYSLAELANVSHSQSVTQMCIELGYYVRDESCFLSKAQWMEATSLGTVEHFIRETSLRIITDKVYPFFSNAYLTHSTKHIVDEVFDVTELPSLRGIIAIGEHMLEFGGFDIDRLIGLMHDGEEADEGPLSYWEAVARESLETWATLGVEPFTDDDAVCNTDAQSYMDEWYWDILTSGFAWGELDWERTAEWGLHEHSLQNIIEMVVNRALAIELSGQVNTHSTTWEEDNA